LNRVWWIANVTSTSRMQKTTYLKFIGLICFFVIGAAQAKGEDNIFPEYQSIKPNVRFWEKIYSQYNSTEGIVHDSENLEIIYEIVPLKPRTTVSNRRYNRRQIRSAKAKYRNILVRLSKGQQPESADAKRVVGLFGSSPQPEILRMASRSIRLQRGQRDRFRNGLIRSGAYIEQMREIFRSNGLPADLAFLPHVESSFHYEAYSKFGAAGIWQFLYRTGKQYMTVNYTVDERWDPIKATRAAVKFLKFNQQQLDSWPLAVTAYNHGTRSMLRAKKAKGGYEAIFNEYKGRRFKFASRNFYSEFLAAREVARNYQKYFGDLKLNAPVSSFIFKVPNYISLKELAKHLNVKASTLHRLNLSLRRPVYREQKYIPKGFKLRLPDSEDLKKRLAKLPASLYKSKQKPSRFYYVRKGDAAGVIARRHGIELQDLIWANNLNSRARIYAGQNLRIPTSEDVAALKAKYKDAGKPLPSAYASVETSKTRKKNRNGELALKQALEKLNGMGINLAIVTGNLPVKSTYQKNGLTLGIIYVQTGETLGHYAEWLQIRTQWIRDLNDLIYGGILQHDRKLIIPLDRVTKEQFEERRYEFHTERQEDFFSAFRVEGIETYQIRRGENIWRLCIENFELPFWLVSKFNTHLNFDNLRPQQQIMVPVVEKIEDDNPGNINSYN
jgi:membrane-bound lytic murein transglycosylase D